MVKPPGFAASALSGWPAGGRRRLHPLRIGFVFVGELRPQGSDHDRICHHGADQEPATRVPVPGPRHLHPLPRHRRRSAGGHRADPAGAGRRRRSRQRSPRPSSPAKPKPMRWASSAPRPSASTASTSPASWSRAPATVAAKAAPATAASTAVTGSGRASGGARSPVGLIVEAIMLGTPGLLRAWQRDPFRRRDRAGCRPTCASTSRPRETVFDTPPGR